MYIPAASFRFPISTTLSSLSAYLILLLCVPALVSAYKPLSDSFLRAIPSPGHDLDPRNGSLLAPILIPRVPGTPGQSAVQRHFVDFFQRELPRWSIEWQNSSAVTPVSGNVEIPFANLIFRREPPWVKPGQSNLLTLVAHYDSKYTPEGFIGATDSAVPCAVLLHVARTVDRYVSQMHDEMAALGEGGTVEMDMGVQILLLDGEEAFEKWSDTDSLYGSRALAKEWKSTPNPPASQFYKYPNPLSQIPLFLLLDLLGAANPTVPSYFPTTHWAYNSLLQVESRMRALHLLESSPAQPFLSDANRTQAQGAVSDDHLPFIAEGVPILHVIPQPFPDVWHTAEDHGGNLDMEVVRDWGKIVVGFVLEWLDMMEVWDEEAVEGGRGVIGGGSRGRDRGRRKAI